MVMHLELDRDIARYRTLTPASQARVRAEAVRRAHALRHAEFRAVLGALARVLRQLLLRIGRNGRRAKTP